jgi:hypothetical protein
MLDKIVIAILIEVVIMMFIEGSMTSNDVKDAEKTLKMIIGMSKYLEQ